MTIRERINREARLLGHALGRGDRTGVADCCYQLHKIADEAAAIGLPAVLDSPTARPDVCGEEGCPICKPARQ